MATQFLGLKARVLLNSFRRSSWQVAGLVVGLALAAFLVVSLSSALLRMRELEAALARDLVVIAGSVVLAAFLLLPLMLDSNQTTDPRSLSSFGLRGRQLSSGLLLAGFVSVPVLSLAVVSTATVVTFGRGFWSVLLALVSIPLVLVTATLGSLIAASIASIMLPSPAARDAAAVLGIVVIIVAAPVLALATALNFTGSAAIAGSLAQVLSWTPLGAAWSVAGDAAAGNGGQAVLKLLIALVFACVMWIGWRFIVSHLVRAPQERQTRAELRGLGLFHPLSAGPTGAIAARSVTYWLRDARYGTSLLVIPVVPILMVVPLAIAGVPLNWLALLPLPIMCLFLGALLHNDVSFDNTAVWLHLASGVKGVADRLGRIFPVLLVGIPLIGIGSLLSVSLFGDWGVLPSMIGLCTCLLLAGVGLSSVMSARFPYPAVRPDDSPFRGPQTTNTTGGVVQAFMFFASFIISAPVIVFAVLGFTVAPEWHQAALLTGIITGLVVLCLGVLAGGDIFERRSPEILAAAMRN